MEIVFNGKRALVTGATRGIGRSIALTLAKCGAKVVVIGRDKNLLQDLAKEEGIESAISVDLSNWNETKAALKDVGPIDLLVNNAGVAILEPLGDISEEHIDYSFAVNVKSVINVTQHVINDMKARNAPAGSIVNISSQASKAGLRDHAVYCATKGALDAFTRAAALELGAAQIRINCVNPTVIMTEMGRLGWSEPTKAGPMLDKIPLKRFGEVEDVTNAVLFLLSDKANMITGQCLAIDGGFLAV